MTPYGDFHFFLIAFIVLIPILLLGLFGKRSKIYNFISTVIMIVLIFSDHKHNLFGNEYLSYQLLSFILYIIWQVVIIKGYERVRTVTNSTALYISAFVLSIIPLAIVKICQSSWLGHGQLHMHSSRLVELFGFLGISYVMFKSVQLIMELRDGSIKNVSIMKLVQFITFFPTISSGPIDRYKRFVKDDDKTPDAKTYRGLLEKAVHYIMLGFLYKYIIAHLIHSYGIVPLQAHHLTTFFDYWKYMYAYSFYLFFDFAGYSLFAVALSYIYGIQTPMNFNQPFKAKNIKDFWNRWHMSLSFWFRDCVYMRIVFYMTKNKMMKKPLNISNFGFLVNFGIMGIWHGLEWFYIIYGFYHAALFILYSYYEKWRKKRFGKLKHPVFNILSIIITFHFVAFGFLIFSGVLFK
ncbi:D-alanyl-lipoteichoic acid biosynthesis protein DltB [Staphylococcus pettenkoferi]|uniref:D-alanyl-lipoteichoic acid biosynthesis protein DltB n=1 Tax=Staphylococcus pettenkoferi TaxID=170573 RepID=UPI002272F168|nr:D-alanyl-lipoteichoic acid biosynthesis protein DltB [Staphylococcus pettenkoferi]MCY1593432.1 D-alanyl-lipoteichoic acid biosynthesis protein DltB [Staphylococcus pettenkoferi]MCY1611801.1 D-alanyl-lipoteichoic acid biosynthesis protein DltB [Staphylococcus pettenkoferi]MCY1625351.1 D-alanyl-lipoteichoic acid biosynthesis protein DltB [Staphylococcus pettenkoferi]